ncbi:MAG: hypothetical protein WB952_08060 [Terriglobales bacterium]
MSRFYSSENMWQIAFSMIAGTKLLRIDEDHRTFITQSHAAAGSQLYVVLEAARLYLTI